MTAALIGTLNLIFTVLKFTSLLGDEQTIWAWIGLVLAIVIAVGAFQTVQEAGGVANLQSEASSLTGSLRPMHLAVVTRAYGGGRTNRWETDLPVGPEGIARYRPYRLRGAGDTQGQAIGPSLLTKTEYVDRDLADWGYRLTAVNHLAEELELALVGTGNAPPTLRIAPNPARAGTPISIEFAMPFLANGTRLNDFDVSVFDLNGRLVRNLVRGVVEGNGGNVELRWDGLTESGKSAATGVYFVRAPDPYGRFGARQRLVLVRLPGGDH